MKFRSFMVLPVERFNVWKDALVNVAAAYIDYLIVVSVFFVQEFGNIIDGVSVQFLYSFSWIGHGNDPGGYVG